MIYISNFSNLIQYNIFRLLLLIVILSELFLFTYTSILSRKSKKSILDKGTIWLVLFAFLVCIILPIFFTSKYVSEDFRNILFPYIFYYIGILLIIFGIAIRWICVFTLKNNFTYIIQTQKNQHLVTGGIYKYVRNPSYTACIIILLGISFSLRHIIALILVTVISIICFEIRIDVEEKALKNQFKQEFKNYCEKTKYKLIPKVY